MRHNALVDMELAHVPMTTNKPIYELLEVVVSLWFLRSYKGGVSRTRVVVRVISRKREVSQIAVVIECGVLTSGQRKLKM
jgi:hypothetical protein